MIATTLNIHNAVLSKINDAALRLNTSRKDIIVLLLKKMMRNHRLFTQHFSSVKYQQDDKDNWHCFHIRFRWDENEFFVDLRKVCKFSVSCLLAIAVEKYLEKLIRDMEKGDVDNYHDFTNYLLHREVIEGIISWHIYWGLPVEHLKTMRM